MTKERKELARLERNKADTQRIDEGKLRAWLEAKYNIWISKGADGLYYLAHYTRNEQDLYHPWGVAALACFKEQDWAELPTPIFNKGVNFADMFGYTTANGISSMRFFVFCWLSEGVYRFTYHGQRANLILIPSPSGIEHSVELLPESMELVGQIESYGRLETEEINGGDGEDGPKGRTEDPDDQRHSTGASEEDAHTYPHMAKGVRGRSPFNALQYSGVESSSNNVSRPHD